MLHNQKPHYHNKRISTGKIKREIVFSQDENLSQKIYLITNSMTYLHLFCEIIEKQEMKNWKTTWSTKNSAMQEK